LIPILIDHGAYDFDADQTLCTRLAGRLFENLTKRRPSRFLARIDNPGHRGPLMIIRALDDQDLDGSGVDGSIPINARAIAASKNDRSASRKPKRRIPHMLAQFKNKIRCSH
jgi:hypothetical protein